MANSKVQYTATGATQVFAVPFSFLSRTHIAVTVDGSSDSFTWNNDSEIVVATVLSGGEIVLIKRSTSPTARVVDFTDGSNLTELELDQDSKQAFYLAQEALDELDLFNDSVVATDTHILIADGTEYVNKAVSGDVTISNTGVTTIGTAKIDTAMITDGNVTLAKMASGSVDSDNIVDDSIVNADINSAAAIAYSKLDLGSSIVSADLVDGTIVNADINASAAIDATKIGGGSVSTTEYDYLANVTSDIQTQLDNIVAGTIADVSDAVINIVDDGDVTKKINFQASGITTGTTRTITMPDSDVTLVASSITASSTDTLTNKTFDANGTGNSLSNVDVADLANGTDGELITWDAAGAPAVVAVGTSGQVLTSGGVGVAPTFQSASAGTSNATVDTKTWNNSDTTLTLSVAPGSVNNVQYYEDGVRQVPTTDYTVSGTTLTRTSTPANGVIGLAVSGGTLTIGTPADGTVTTAKIATGAIDETLMKDAFIADFTEVTVAAGDSILLGDADDSGNTKRDTVQGILDLVPTSGGLILISAQTASTSSTIDFTGLDTTYEALLLVGSGITVSTNMDLQLQMGTGAGPTWDTTGYNGISFGYDSGGNLRTNTASGASSGKIIGGIDSTGTGIGFAHWIYGLGSSVITRTSGTGSAEQNTGGLDAVFVSGGNLGSNATAGTGLRVLTTSGTITVGEFKLYGLVKA
jgi:hypothetical protein